jgi:GTP pyrophosphokinase
VQPRQVFVKLVPDDKLREKAPDGPVAAVVRRMLGSGEEKIKVRGFDDLMVFRARCCNPIRGEKIVGYITRGKGVSVHSATCPNVVNLLYDPERRIDVEWDKAPATDPAARYTVKLTMEVEDRKGLLAAVSAKIADLNTNIRNMEAHTDEGRRARLDMTVEINDLTHLEKVIKSLKNVDGVLGVERAGRAG